MVLMPKAGVIMPRAHRDAIWMWYALYKNGTLLLLFKLFPSSLKGNIENDETLASTGDIVWQCFDMVAFIFPMHNCELIGMMYGTLIIYFLFNPLKTSPEYTRVGVYGKCVLYQNQIVFNGLIVFQVLIERN